MRLFVYSTGVLSFMLLPLSVLFKLLHWQGANILLICGILVFAFLFVPFAGIYLYKTRKKMI